jgi:hypothetical protein
MALEVEKITLDATDISNGYISLTYTPVDVGEVAVDPTGGPAQILSYDFIVVGNQVIWDHVTIPNSDMKQVIDGGTWTPMEFRIIYER